MELLRIRGVATLLRHRLQLTLTDGSVVERDIAALLEGPVFGALGDDETLFANARVVDGSIEWPNGADICPDVLIWGECPRIARKLGRRSNSSCFASDDCGTTAWTHPIAMRISVIP